LGALYEQLDPSLDPSNNYTLPEMVEKEQHIIAIASQDLPPVQLPIVQPESHNLRPVQLPFVQPEIYAITEKNLLESPGLVSRITPTPETTSLEPEKSVSRGRKRKGEEPIGRPAKKKDLKDVENADLAEVENRSVKDPGEGTAKRNEVKERGGKPTLSGRVPLMPSHLAEAGYQGEKKGVRGTGRKVQLPKKPKSKGYTTKPSSKGAVKIPGKKKIK
jgi:hypothetical protein